MNVTGAERMSRQRCYCIGSGGLLTCPFRPFGGLFCRFQPETALTEVKRMNFFLETQNLILLIMALVSGAALIVPLLREGSTSSVTPAQAVMLINRQHAVLVDVRDAAELESGRIASALTIPLGELGKRIGELEKYKTRPIIVLCATGNRSAKGAGVLRKAGFAQVFNLDGGIKSWKSAGQPLVGGTKA